MLRKASVRFALATFTSIEFFYELTISEFLDIAHEIEVVSKDGK